MTTNITNKPARTKQEFTEPRLEPASAPSPSSDPLAGIIANAADNQRRRDEERAKREREAKEARARFALD